MKKLICLFKVSITILSTVNFATAQLTMVDDVNATVNTPQATPGFAVSNGILYFFAGNTIRGLWRSDGTQAGTYLVKNFSTSSYSQSNLTDVNGTIYFSAQVDGEGYGIELWKSDGTETGTVMVKDIEPGINSSNPYNLNNIDGTLYFFATNSVYGTELWRSDGSESGTYMVKDITPGIESTNFGPEMFSYNGKVLFGISTSGLPHKQLWSSDGTATGTKKLKDFGYSTSGAGAVDHFNELNGNAYFIVNDATAGISLWKTDATTPGTVLVKSFTPGCLFCDGVAQLCKVNNTLVMEATDSTHGLELWGSDGTTLGTNLLKDINPGTLSSFPDHLTVIGNEVYFSATDPLHGREIWRTDGTATGTTIFLDYIPGLSSLTDESDFIGVEDKIIFTSPYFGDQLLYSTDGTVSGTVELTGAAGGTGNDYLSFTNFNNEVYFTYEIVSLLNGFVEHTDGTYSGTGIIPYTPSQTNSSNPVDMIKLNANNYLFNADDGIHGNELWITDGTPGATSLLKDINSGTTATKFSFGPVLNGKLLFAASTPDGTVGLNQTLWVSDGTALGTVQISNCNPAPNFLGKFAHAEVNNITYFMGSLTDANTTHFSIWRSDGTAAGTYPLKEFYQSGTTSNLFGDMVALNGKVYFNGYDATHGYELWISDGTPTGTYLFDDISTGSMSSNPAYLTSFNGKIYFFASKSDNGYNDLWKSDGVLGTKEVRDLNVPGSPITVSGDYFYFVASADMWRSDGTHDGTFLIKSAVSITGHYSGADVDGTFFFIVHDGFEGDELWKSDGSVAGTVFLKTVGYPSWDESDFNNVNGVLYFVSHFNGSFEQSLWRSDGTPCQTVPINLAPGIDDQANILTVDGSKIFLSLNSELYGVEPYQDVTTAIVNYEICNGIDDDCNGIVDDNVIVATISPSGILSACKGTAVTLTANNTGSGLTYQWRKDEVVIAGATNLSYTNNNEEGSFDVVVTTSLGCSDISDATLIHRKALPKAKITALGNLDICTTGVVDLQASSGNNYVYQWKKNGVNIPGATDQVYHATEIGDYKVNVMGGNDCSKTSAKVTVFTSCKQSVQDDGNMDWELFPNPATDHISITCPDNGKLVITNLLGETVLTLSLNSTEMNIDVSSFIPGVYLLYFMTGNRIVAKKFVKE